MNAMTDHIPVITTQRLRLRAPKLDDLPAFYEFFATSRSEMVGGPMDERAVHRSLMSTIGSWALKGHGMWHIADKDTDAILGATGIINLPGWHEPELGWSLLAHAEGKGIAFEAATAARRYAAQHLGHDSVISYIDPSNDRSAALATRLGAMLERATTFLDKPVNIWRHPKEAA